MPSASLERDGAGVLASLLAAIGSVGLIVGRFQAVQRAPPAVGSRLVPGAADIATEHIDRKADFLNLCRLRCFRQSVDHLEPP
jgi:hypothetical protein